MRHYEVIFMVHPDQSEQVPAMLDRYADIVTEDGGTIHRQEDWGRRQLAYQIDKLHKAHYALMNIECSTDALKEIESSFVFNDAVLRHMVIRRNEAVTETSLIMQAKEEKNARQAEEDARREAAAKARRERQQSTEDDSSDANESEKAPAEAE